MNKYKIKNYYNYFKSWRRIMRRYNCAFSSQFSLPPDWYYLISGAALLCTRLLKRLDPTGMAVQVAIIQICRANWSKKNEEKLRLKVWHVHLDVNRRARVPSWTRKKVSCQRNGSRQNRNWAIAGLPPRSNRFGMRSADSPFVIWLYTRVPYVSMLFIHIIYIR
jgi:hypothetical protein